MAVYRKPALAFLLAAATLLLLGGMVLAGWVFVIPVLTRINLDWPPMVPATAFCFTLSGLLLLVANKAGGRSSAFLQATLAGIILLLATARLVELLFNMKFGVAQFPLASRVTLRGNSAMALPTVTSFFLFGIGVLFDRYVGKRMTRFVRVLAIVLVAIGFGGVFGYLFKLQYLFEPAYVLTGLSSMAFPTSCGVVLLGFTLFSLSGGETVAPGSDEIGVNRVYRTTVFVVLGMALVGSLTGLALVEESVGRDVTAGMEQTLKARRAFIDADIEFRAERALVAGDGTELSKTAQALARDADNSDILARAAMLAGPLLNHGFTGVAVERGDTKKIVVGKMLPDTAFGYRLQGEQDISLVWDNGYFLRVRAPVDGGSGGTKTGPADFLITEQALPLLSKLLDEANHWGESGYMPMCARLDAARLQCFPQREESVPYIVPDTINGAPIPMALGLAKEEGVAASVDYRGRHVLAAYGSIGSSGLALVLKMDLAEVYAPIKHQLLFALPMIAALGIMGLWLIRWRVRPLVQNIASAHAAEKSERERFTAAMESSPDPFIIYDSVKSPTGDIVDFSFAYINGPAYQASGITVNAVGMSLRKSYPDHDATFFKYREVVRSGIPWIEEFTHHDSVGATYWYLRQAVPMPEGIAITFRDITREKNLTLSLDESNRLRTAIVESAAYAIISTDVNGTILTFNKAAERMLWYRAEEVIGTIKPGGFHDPDEIVARAKALSAELGMTVEPGFDVFTVKSRMGVPDEHEWSYVRKDGSKFPVRISVTALRNPQGELEGYLGIAYDISEQKRAEEYIRHIALHDVLTGLPNRALLEDRVAVAIEQQRRNSTPFALAMMDIDRFKHVNDSMGHHVGDSLLKEFVARVKACIRPTDTLARMGGDEFVLLLSDSDESGAEVVAKRIMDACVAPIAMGQQELHISTSMGISAYPRDGEDMNELLRCADVAMYWVKAHGRNGYKMFSREMDRGTTERLVLETDLHRALDNQEFSLFYQPQIDFRSGAIVGVEALLRWHKPDGQFVSPATFIPLAEDTGLIVPIGHWVLKNACRDAVRLTEVLGRPIRVAVNISPRQFVNGDLVGAIVQALEDSGLQAGQLELEITEGVLMDERVGVASALNELSAYGVKIAIDDFGTGYSSLSYLKRFPIKKLKIDQSFVRDVTSDPSDAALAVAIVAMGHSLNIPVTAEGIETAEQMDFLVANQCDHGQGFFIGRPMPFEKLLQWFADEDRRRTGRVAAAR